MGKLTIGGDKEDLIRLNHSSNHTNSLGFLFGYDSGIITSTIAQPRFIKYFNNLSDNVTGGIVSSFQSGTIPGTMIDFFFGTIQTH